MMMPMRCTLWTLVCALLLQVLGVSAWAIHQPQTPAGPVACHESAVTSVAHGGHEAASDDAQALHQAHSSHHCCAIGLGMGLAPIPQPLPQSAPVSHQPLWASLSLRPDLRPPI